MSRALVILKSMIDRERVCRWAMNVPLGTRVEFKETKRTIPQNDRLHAMLTDISNQLLWHGVKLEVDDWKLVFMDALKREMRIVPNIHGNGFVNIGRSTSKLSKSEFSDLFEIIHEFAAKHDITFKDPAGLSPPSAGPAGERPSPRSPANQSHSDIAKARV